MVPRRSQRRLVRIRDLVGAVGVVLGATLFCVAVLDWISYSVFLKSLYWR